MSRKVGLIRKYALKAAIKRREDFQEFLGISLRKLPSDCIAIHKLLCRCRPKVIVETGTQFGGSALMYSTYAEQIGIEAIITVDVADIAVGLHPMIKFVKGDSSDPAVVRQVHDLVAGRPCSVILDSNHFADHVAKELDLYQDLITPGQALIVEDTHVDALDFRNFRKVGGPLRALDEFLKKDGSFVEAEGIEPYVTTNYFGYLVRK